MQLLMPEQPAYPLFYARFDLLPTKKLLAGTSEQVDI
ncbi:MAG: hypothetical protein RIR31_138 [Bacteroidota bacterium]|jgi:hypothetical protein